MRGHRLDPVARRTPAQQIDRARADRAGGAKQRHAYAVPARTASTLAPAAALASSALPYQQAARGRSRSLRAIPISSAARAATRKPSSRSIKPPWPGMSWLASLAPKRRLTADSNKSPACARTDRTQRHDPNDPQLADPARISDRDAGGNPPGQTADRAGPGLLRADPRPQQRTADRPPAEIGEMSVIQTVANRNRSAVRPHCGSRRSIAGAISNARRHRSPRRRPRPSRGSTVASPRGQAAAMASADQHRRRCTIAAQRRASSEPASTAAQQQAGHPGARTRSIGAPATSDVHSHRMPPAATRTAQRKASRRHRRPRARPAPARRPTPRAASRLLAPRPPVGRRAGRGMRRAGHDPVLATNPPKRRSRRRYSAMAPSSAARSKSGQLIGTKTSSL